MSAPYISIVLSICMLKILSNLVEIWWSSDKDKLGHFGTPCTYTD